jgi:sulfopyruvate decarboxylase subunit beta
MTARMKRDAALAILARHVTDEIVVAVYQAAFDWMRIASRELNFVSVGAMGQASSHGLGFALGRPDRRVIVLDGDGSLLMNLGSLVTIANAAPRNLLHLVFQNDCYEANGSHPIPGASRVDFAALAIAAGYRAATTVDSLEAFNRGAADLVAAPGPSFAALKVEPGTPSSQDYDYIHSGEARDRFRRAVNSA